MTGGVLVMKGAGRVSSEVGVWGEGGGAESDSCTRGMMKRGV